MARTQGGWGERWELLIYEWHKEFYWHKYSCGKQRVYCSACPCFTLSRGNADEAVTLGGRGGKRIVYSVGKL